MIDYSDVASMYGSTYANAANQTANKLQNTLDGVKGTASKDELMDACRQFEAYFVEQMFKSMMKTVPSEGNTSNYTSTMMDYYKDQMVQAMAEETTNQNGGFGLAQMLYEQMKRNFGTADIAVDTKEAAESPEAVAAAQ